MKEWFGQVRYSHEFKRQVLVPDTEEDAVIFSNYKLNQIVANKTTGIKKLRSYLQLKLIKALGRKTGQNTNNPLWNTQDKALMQCKIKADFVDGWIAVDTEYGQVQVPMVKSLRYRDADHAEVTIFAEKAIGYMADHLECSVDELKSSFNDVD